MLAAVTESVWTDEDRALVLALLAEQRETCSSCGHPMSQCRDPATAQRWTVIESVCQPGRVMAAAAENNAKVGRRGIVLGSKLG